MMRLYFHNSCQIPFATDLKNYKQHTEVIGHGLCNYPLMEVQNIAFNCNTVECEVLVLLHA